MTLIDKVVDASCFDWELYTGHQVLSGEVIYTIGDFVLSFYSGNAVVENGDDWVGAVAIDVIPAAEVARVIDTLVQNYREA